MVVLILLKKIIFYNFHSEAAQRTQKGNLILMEAIKKFFINLAKFNDLRITWGFVYITNVNITRPEASNYVLSIKNNDFIDKVLIPFFDSMIWHSKKELDYLCSSAS